MNIPTFSQNSDPALRKLDRFIEWFLLTLILCVTLLVCCSCGSTKVVTQTVRDVSVDTVYLSNVQYDSIPYQVTITETKEIQRPLTWYDHLSRAILWLNIGFVILLFIRFIRKIKRP